MAITDIQSAFNAGEISPELYGEISLKKYSSAATTLRNAYVNYRGGARSRAGFAFVGRCKQTTSPSGGAAATGSIHFAGNPSPGDTITLNGVVWTFVASGAGTAQTNIQGTLPVTIAVLRNNLNSSVNAALTVATYSQTVGDRLDITYDTVGTAGNAYTMSASVATPSGPTLTGGVNAPPAGPPRPIPFQFSITQGYVLEFGQEYLRFVFQGGYVLEDSVAVTGAAQTNPCAIGVTGTPFAAGDWVYFSGVGGMTPLNGNTYLVKNPSAGIFYLTDLDGIDINSTGFPAYTSGGTVARLYTLTTPYQVNDLPYLKFSQSADVMTLTCANPTNIGTVPGVAATGYIFFSANPSAAATVTLNGVVWTFVASGAVGNQINILGTAAATISSLVFALNASVDPLLTVASYNATGGPSTVTLLVSYNTVGTVGNTYTLAASAATRSGATLAGGANVTNLGEYPPYTLTRLAANQWTLVATNFNAVISPPTNVSAASNAMAGASGINATFNYCATAVDRDGNESIASTITSCNGADIQVEGGTNTITWDLVAGAKYYNVYRTAPSVDDSGGAVDVPEGAVFGFVGSAYGTSFNDTIAVSDLTQTPPIHQNPFAPGQILAVDITNPSTGLATVAYTITTSTGSDLDAMPLVIGGVLGGFFIQNHGQNYAASDTITFTAGMGTPPTGTLVVGPQSGTYPGVNAYFQQRLFFASSFNNPDTFWGSQTGLYRNFDVSSPPIATDAITASPWSEQVNGIQWLVPMPGGLIAFTGLRAWQINGEGGSGLNPQPITPSSTQAQPQAFNGCSATIPPVVVDYDVLYVQAIGNSTVYDLAWNFWVNIYTGNDLTILSSHLFDGRQIVQWAWARLPDKILWACTDDGILLSLTYLKEQEVYGWARHDTLGFVAGLCSISEPPVNAVYAIIQRSSLVNAFGNYTMERLDNRLWTTVEDTYAVDSGVSNPMSYPNCNIRATARTGSGVTFLASDAVFSASSVGQILRMSGGIAEITGHTDGYTITGTWVLDASAGSVTFGIFNAPYAAAGTWSIATPVTSLNAPHLYGTGGGLVGLGDGVPMFSLSADSDGNIALPFAASDVKVGLPFTVQIQTPYMNGQNAVQGARKVIPAATVRIHASGSFEMGTNQPDGGAENPPEIAPTWTDMADGNIEKATGGQTSPVQYTSPGGETVTPLFTGDLRVVGKGASWISKGQVAIQQRQPLPLEVLAVIPETLPGDAPEVTYHPEQKPKEPRGPGMWQLR